MGQGLDIRGRAQEQKLEVREQRRVQGLEVEE